MLSGLVDVEALARALHLCSLGGLARKGYAIRWFTNYSYWSISFDEAEELDNQFRFCKDPKLPFLARLGVPVDGGAGLCYFMWTSVCVI